jgi:restriction endonuclease S subunit
VSDYGSQPSTHEGSALSAIPEGWDRKPLGSLGSFKNGINKGSEAFGHGDPFVNLMDVFGVARLSNTESLGLVASTEEERRAFNLRAGDVLFVRSSVKPSGVGLATLVTNDLNRAVYSGFLLRFRSDERLTSSLKAYIFAEHGFRQRVIAGSTVSANTNINQRTLQSISVSFPRSRSEQDAIGHVLSDVDDLIHSLERLIAKKQAIKQGMMQQLLTGRARLQGFSQQWTSLHVASRSVLKARIGWQGLTTSEYRASGLYRLVGGTEFLDGSVNWRATPFVDKWRYDQDIGIQLRQGDVLLTKDGSIGKTAYVDKLPGPATLNSGVFVIRPVRDAYHSRFLYFTLRSRAFAEFLTRLSAGSTISHLYQRDLVGLTLDVPPTVEEQRAIARVLSDAENEIDTLRTRLDKTRAEKQGMMQQLLTGRTRLPVPEAAV